MKAGGSLPYIIALLDKRTITGFGASRGTLPDQWVGGGIKKPETAFEPRRFKQRFPADDFRLTNLEKNPA